jgi:hypothetical protein
MDTHGKDQTMSEQERNLLELLRTINLLERRCRTLGDAVEPVPAQVYKLLSALRDELARWGCEAVVEHD